MSNIFKNLGDSFSTEDFFTACTALFVQRNARFRDSFLKWLEDACGERLRDSAWVVEIQSASRSCAGMAVLDMKLRHPDIELWFEHKVDASLGQRRTTRGKGIDQIEKYLDAAARVMSGVSVGDDDVDWPASGPVSGQPRVLLFYISRSGKLPEKSKYDGKLHQPGGFGLVWPESPLRWKDFWPSAELALQPVVDGEAGDFEATLTKQFLSYWQSLFGMWTQVDYDADWRELATYRDGERFGFEPLWGEVQSLATEMLGWTYKQGWMGNWHAYGVPTESPTRSVSKPCDLATRFGAIRMDWMTRRLRCRFACVIHRERYQRRAKSWHLSAGVASPVSGCRRAADSSASMWA